MSEEIQDRLEGAGQSDDERESENPARLRRLDLVARAHIEGRNQAVVQVLSYLSMLRNGGAVSELAPIHSIPAIRSAARSGSAHAQAGIHCLPCQIQVDGRDPLTFAPNARARRAMLILFGTVVNAPVCFHVADAVAGPGRTGLAASFRAACEFVLRCARLPANGSAWPVDERRVTAAYRDVWWPGARTAYAAALEQLETGPLCIEQPHDPEEIPVVLGRYLEHHGRHQLRFPGPRIAELERLLHP